MIKYDSTKLGNSLLRKINPVGKRKATRNKVTRYGFKVCNALRAKQADSKDSQNYNQDLVSLLRR